MKKRTMLLFLSVLMLFSVLRVSAKTMYAPDGRTVSVDEAAIQAWQEVGWYTEPVMKVYAADGRESVIYKSQYAAWNAVGWYDYPVMYMYSPYGKTATVSKAARKNWEAVGWYSYPVVMLYAPDGRTVTVSKADYEAWKAVGWKKAPAVNPKDMMVVGGKAYYLGMPRAELGTADEKFDSIYGFKWYVFGTDTYKNFFAAGIEDGKVVALVSCGESFGYAGYNAGDAIYEKNEYTRNLYTDKYNKNSIHTVFLNGIGKAGYNTRQYVTTNEADRGESKLNFHLVNAFRVYHARPILKWSERAAESARLHSMDMNIRNFFDHVNPDGEYPGDRMLKQGIKDWSGENIAAGHENAIEVHDGWINSLGHRNNMLYKWHAYLGVGIGNAKFTLTFTQNFHR